MHSIIQDKEFIRPEDVDIETILEQGFGRLTGELITVRIQFDNHLLQHFEERKYHNSQNIISTNPLIVEFTTYDNNDLITWIMGWKDSAIVLEPESVKKSVLNYLNKTINKYN